MGISCLIILCYISTCIMLLPIFDNIIIIVQLEHIVDSLSWSPQKKGLCMFINPILHIENTKTLCTCTPRETHLAKEQRKTSTQWRWHLPPATFNFVCNNHIDRPYFQWHEMRRLLINLKFTRKRFISRLYIYIIYKGLGICIMQWNLILYENHNLKQKYQK